MDENISKMRLLFLLVGLRMVPMFHVASATMAYPHSTPLHAAVMAQDLDAVYDALMANMRAVNHKVTYGMTALHLAVLIGHLPIVEALIQEGADPRERDDVGDTPLHIAARTRNLYIAWYLLEHFADPDAWDDERRTPLHWAAWNNDFDMVRMLMSYGANPHRRTRWGWYASNFTKKLNIRHFLSQFM
ncbi:MAG: ankyrin repeat domain-containing protein [Puniceicoccales bacterium]|jgi:ankyrin repeat protein|nr:ankyrin repeat domain-containing protein [Puniceicoccales bacterium]